jgi:GntR family transcriptional regulator, arabinose operon transcriptional repressor
MNPADELKGRAKYLDIVESVRSDISAGRYKSGGRLPSEAELVRKFAVSRMTVVKAMRQLQQEGLLIRRAGSGTYAANPVVDESMIFGLLIPDLGQTEIFEPICRGMVRSPLAAKHSLSWVQTLSTAEHAAEEAEQLCQRYIEQSVSGVFFAPQEFAPPHHDVNGRILKALDKADIPVILLDRCVLKYPQRSNYDLIGLDNRRAGYIVTNHLVRQGAQRVAFFAREGSAETVEERIAGYHEALYYNNLPILRELLVRGDATDKGFVEQVLRTRKIDAIMCANDITAANLMQTLLSLHVRIPDDVRIAGVDDVKYAKLLPIPLTTYQQPCAEIGAVSMSAMVERVKNRQLPARSILLNGTLVVRQSCGARSAI